MEGNPFDPWKGLGRAIESLQKGEVPDVAAVIEEVLTLPAFKEPAAIAQGYQMAGSWVLKPEGARKGVIHFLGGAFVGASPQVSYGRLMEELSNLGFIVISTPYDLTFDHATCAYRTATALDDCLAQLCITPAGAPVVEGFQQLPLYALGHSNGALLHLLAGSLESCRETASAHVQRAVLMSYNNKNVSEAVPGGVPEAATPVANKLTEWRAEILPQLETVRVEMAPRIERLVPPQVLTNPVLLNATTQLLPLLNQLNPAVDELADGTRDFTPTPEESRAIILDGYSVPGTLLIRFKDDSIDESPEMAAILIGGGPPRAVELDEMEGGGLGHLAPLGATIEWQVGKQFTPLDALGQALRGDTDKRVNVVATRIGEWLIGSR